MTLDMLDLQWNAEARFYDAPLHVKALNGMMLIDDFGRQKFAPNDLLNRWIVPMESQVDFMKLHTGASFTLPFDVLLMFSTNLHPADLMDAAFLRRIQYKIKLFEPTRDEYRQIFSAVARSRGLELQRRGIRLRRQNADPVRAGVLSAALHLRPCARNVQIIRSAAAYHDRAGGRSAGQSLCRYRGGARRRDGGGVSVAAGSLSAIDKTASASIASPPVRDRVSAADSAAGSQGCGGLTSYRWSAAQFTRRWHETPWPGLISVSFGTSTLQRASA